MIYNISQLDVSEGHAHFHLGVRRLRCNDPDAKCSYAALRWILMNAPKPIMDREVSMKPTLDAGRLLDLARTKTAESKTELAAIVDSLFEGQGTALSDREKSLMFNIIHQLVREVEVSVRKKLSEKFAADADVPRALIKELACDELEVAYPILTQSKVLRDEDLIEIIRLRTEEFHLAITLRDGISESVSDALIETDNAGVITQLLENESAQISHAALEYLVDQSKRVDTFQEPLLRRSELPQDLAKKMFMWVSAALRHHIVERYDIDAASVDRLLEQAAREGYESTLTEKIDHSSALIKSLRERGMITPQMLVKTLLDGEIPLFLAIFSDLTQLNDVAVRRIVFDKSGEGIAIACKAIDFSEYDFVTIYRKSRRVAPGRADATRADVNTMLDIYRTIDQGEALSVVDMWRRDKDYLSAIRDLVPEKRSS